MEQTYMKKVSTSIIATLLRITEEKGIDMNEVTVERADNFTYYLHGKKVIMIVEWKGFRHTIIE